MNESKYEAGYQDGQHPTGTGKPTIPIPTANEGAPPMREAGTRLIDRINDDGPSRNADAATSDLESRITGPQRLVDQIRQPDDRMSQMECDYQKYSTTEQQPKMSVVRKIGLGAITALGGGAGVARGLENRNQRFDQQQEQRQQRAESLLSQITAQREPSTILRFRSSSDSLLGRYFLSSQTWAGLSMGLVCGPSSQKIRYPTPFASLSPL